MRGMTKRQKEAHEILVEHPALTPEELGALLGTSPQGAAATASSLVTRGSARRTREHGRVRYEGVRT